MPHLRLFRTIMLLAALASLLAMAAAHATAQDATPPAAGTIDPASLTEALTSAEPPAELPGSTDADIELVTWEEYYGEELENVESAWLLTGSAELPLATMIVFASSDDAQSGVEGFRQDSSQFTVGGLDAWTVADRGKWICITSTGPMVVIGQAWPEDIDEPEEEVEVRSCAVLEATLTWLNDDVIGVPLLATPSASPTS